MKKYYYCLYGQLTESEIELPEALEIPFTEETSVLITLGLPPSWVLDSCKKKEYDYLSEDIMWFYLPGLVLYYVEKGKQITVWKESNKLSDLFLRSYLLGSAFSLLLMQKNILPIHGSALAYGDFAYLISGASGSGKSTTTLELMEQGFDFVSDDICPLDLSNSQISLYPGPPWQKVCRDVMERSEHTYYYIDENRDKFARKLSSGYRVNPLRPKAMFILTPCQTNFASIEELQGINKLHALTHNLYRGEKYHRFGISPKRMQLFLDAAKHLNIYILKRPYGVNSVKQLATIIKQHLN
ncbi:hypothetical protein LJC58_05065 [Lachnospiraceae bacterium OttesenSCG-928-D06]|nr:hypothetical protein [Lachnospiraceae bacterium OttesenSCG-928-D06]